MRIFELACLGIYFLVKIISNCASNFHIRFLDIVILSHFGGCELSCLLDLAYLLVSQADDYIFRLEVCMYDLAHPVNVVKTYETLSCQLANQW